MLKLGCAFGKDSSSGFPFLGKRLNHETWRASLNFHLLVVPWKHQISRTIINWLEIRLAHFFNDSVILNSHLAGKFVKFEETHSTVYKRNKSSPLGEDDAEWQLMLWSTFSASPKNTVISVHPSRSLQEGDAVTMTCSSEGLPAPEIFWSKKLDNGNLQLLSGNATLTLVAMRMEDSGNYVCEGVNLVGRNKAEVELTVQGE